MALGTKMHTDAHRQETERDQKTARFLDRAKFFLTGVLVTLIGTLGSDLN